MSVGVLLISHPGVGSSLLHTTVRIIGGCPLPVKCLEVPVGADVAAMADQAQEHLDQLDSGAGVLLLYDLYGATPANIGCTLSDRHPLAMVSGVNLPMLLRIMNYPRDDLETLCHKAIEGGLRGIQICHQPPACDQTS